MTRRQALIGALVTGGVVAGCRIAGATPPPATADSDFAALEHRHGARIGMWALDLGTGQTLGYRPDDRQAMCSTFKTYAVGRVLHMVAGGVLDLNSAIPITAGDIVVDSPVTSKRVGTSMSLAELCEAALVFSDNSAGNALLRSIGGPPAITSFARGLGDDQTRLDRWEPDLNSALPGDPRDCTTPRALVTGYRALMVGDALDPPSRDRLLSWMQANVTSDKRFRAGLPPGWTSADKTGAGDFGVTNDAGLLIGPTGQRILVAVLTRSAEDQMDAPRLNDAVADTVRLTLARWGHHQGGTP
ncbi:class A beta-lactamase [Mycobacterium sp. Root265]|uniref:class A beta-lactamase n=1 Tax=Mycobacterium sp. Root265 TaxID=1736504 RepID=UPI00070C22FA|nr:class A beta-lactamase [Mycobacterium sp. Root265]KRD07873.1 class A beta-lactamase [Mycobacterium sp. Root265]